MPKDTSPLVYTVAEAADMLRISRTTLYELISSNKITYIKVGRLTRFRLKDLEKFIDACAKKTAEKIKRQEFNVTQLK